MKSRKFLTAATLLAGMAVAAQTQAACTYRATGVPYGIETVRAGQIYVVHSALVKPDGRLDNTSNIYVIKGQTNATSGRTQVYLFGAGYGDAGGDLTYYLDIRDGDQIPGNTSNALRSAAADAEDVNCTITQPTHFNLVAGNVDLRFIAPHYHVDHVHQELFTALVNSHGYRLDRSLIYVHALDRGGVGCTTACCLPTGSTEVCTTGSDGSDASGWFGAPYDLVWADAVLARVRTLGTATDIACSTVSQFGSPTGNWSVLFTPGHTSGTLSLKNDKNKYYLEGSGEPGQVCTAPCGYQEWPIHGNTSRTVACQ